ncbi:hypothetical protein LWI29_023466 [Acer saccharum]|uniref:Uncharacterized protein n=1 Tax=Acer saccharum TaxID=4024 RepID=A0AA39VC55_ACESA|nr:hypothetical protein LWI29_023466 [Acer saccharum]
MDVSNPPGGHKPAFGRRFDRGEFSSSRGGRSVSLPMMDSGSNRKGSMWKARHAVELDEDYSFNVQRSKTRDDEINANMSDVQNEGVIEDKWASKTRFQGQKVDVASGIEANTVLHEVLVDYKPLETHSKNNGGMVETCSEGIFGRVSCGVAELELGSDHKKGRWKRWAREVGVRSINDIGEGSFIGKQRNNVSLDHFAQLAGKETKKG